MSKSSVFADMANQGGTICGVETNTTAAASQTPNILGTTVASGSSVAYTPVTGATAVYYRYATQVGRVDEPTAFSFELRKGGTAVTGAHRQWGIDFNYDFGECVLSWVFNSGDLSGWTSDVTLDVIARNHAANYEVHLHLSNWSGGTTTGKAGYPHYMIYSIM